MKKLMAAGLLCLFVLLAATPGMTVRAAGITVLNCAAELLERDGTAGEETATALTVTGDGNTRYSVTAAPHYTNNNGGKFVKLRVTPAYSAPPTALALGSITNGAAWDDLKKAADGSFTLLVPGSATLTTVSIWPNGKEGDKYTLVVNISKDAEISSAPASSAPVSSAPASSAPASSAPISSAASAGSSGLNPQLNIDTDGDGKPDLNIDTNNDGEPELNIDINNDGEPEINVDIDGDGMPDLNIDTNNDGKIDANFDANHNGVLDIDEQAASGAGASSEAVPAISSAGPGQQAPPTWGEQISACRSHWPLLALVVVLGGIGGVLVWRNKVILRRLKGKGGRK